MSGNLDSSGRVKCDVCRTINLAKNAKHPKPDMQIYEKCSPMKKITCATTPEYPLQPTCIKVCTKEEFKLKGTKPVVTRLPHYAHGKLMYAVKAGILVGAVYFTYTQGVWGDQQDVTECIRRWKEYIRSINTRQPPSFDSKGRVITKESVESLVAPLYEVYKSIITTCFAGVVKVPLIIKCAYVDYIKALEKKFEHEQNEAKLKKTT